MVKLIAQLSSASLLFVGLISQSLELAVGGAVIHALMSLAHLFSVHKAAKLLRTGSAALEEKITLPTRIGGWIEGSITLTGLLLVVITHRERDSMYAIPGWIIWGTALFAWLAAGMIARHVGGIPLRMGYGGWTVHRPRSRRPRG